MICDLVPEGEAVVVLRQDTIQTPGSVFFKGQPATNINES